MLSFAKACKELIKSLPTGLGQIKAVHPEGMRESCWEAGFSLGLGAWRACTKANVWGCFQRWETQVPGATERDVDFLAPRLPLPEVEMPTGVQTVTWLLAGEDSQ